MTTEKPLERRKKPATIGRERTTKKRIFVQRTDRGKKSFTSGSKREDFWGGRRGRRGAHRGELGRIRKVLQNPLLGSAHSEEEKSRRCEGGKRKKNRGGEGIYLFFLKKKCPGEENTKDLTDPGVDSKKGKRRGRWVLKEISKDKREAISPSRERKGKGGWKSGFAPGPSIGM